MNLLNLWVRKESLTYVLSICLLLVKTTGCQRSSTQGGAHESIREDIYELRRIINVPFEPTSVKWQLIELGKYDSRTPGLSDSKVLAILEYNVSDLRLLIEEDEKAINQDIYLEKNFLESWFPDEIKNSFFFEDGYLRIKSRAYNADLFSRYPYSDGFFFMHKNLVFVWLQT